MVERCAFKIGDLIDNKYTIVSNLGEGAFGMVYKVTDSTGQFYALKVLKLWEVHPEIRTQLSERFEMEYKTGQIKSPYLVQSHGYGIIKGNPYFLMEFCSKGDLRKSSSDTDWLLVGTQVLLGLKVLHKNGKVHRDLKPENVLIKADGTAVLTDFGISGDRNKRMTERNILGKPQQIFGTYAYMPPEQVNPHRDATVLPTTDIFSFGVMMYELITGTLPFGSLNDDADLVNYINSSKRGIWDREKLRTSYYGQIYSQVIEGCLHADFRMRLQSIDDVLSLLPTVRKNISEEVFVVPKNVRGIMLRVMQGEEYGSTYDITTLGRLNHGLLTMGRNDATVRNIIPICEKQSMYISRKHCTLEYDSSGCWFIRDGQWDKNYSGGWKNSLNGTFVNAKEITQNGYYLSIGDIISIGDTKLRVEAY